MLQSWLSPDEREEISSPSEEDELPGREHEASKRDRNRGSSDFFIFPFCPSDRGLAVMPGHFPRSPKGGQGAKALGRTDCSFPFLNLKGEKREDGPSSVLAEKALPVAIHQKSNGQIPKTK